MLSFIDVIGIVCPTCDNYASISPFTFQTRRELYMALADKGWSIDTDTEPDSDGIISAVCGECNRRNNPRYEFARAMQKGIMVE